MLNKLVLYFLLMSYSLVGQQHVDLGVNIKGYRSYWKVQKIRTKDVKKQIDDCTSKGIYQIRIPVSFNLYLNSKENLSRSFKKALKKIAKYALKRKVTLIFCNFNHKINQDNYIKESLTMTNNWLELVECVKKYDHLYYELLNEPNLFPNEWWSVADTMVSKIIHVKKDAKILLGATNFNSIYELSRLKPLDYKNITYIFHFYEPFLFTHQGASWVEGNQTSTIGIPYPYEVSKMPLLDKNAEGTSGEVNYRDYIHTGNKESLFDKLSIIKKWSQDYDVPIWCTEFGVINNADNNSQKKYFRDLLEVFEYYKIKHFLWTDEDFFTNEQLDLIGL